jgi:NAD(P)H-dependent FMN reductase
MKLMVIWGSSRQGRQGGVVADWIHQQSQADSRFEVDFVDTRELQLPFYDEPGAGGPFSFKSIDDYSNPKGKAWAQRVDKAEGFIIITPEYNHAAPAVLKNALDWVGRPWVDKPVALISYGGISGGARAVELLRPTLIELGLIQVATPLHFPYYSQAFDDKGQPTRLDYYDANLKKMFDEIIRLHDIFLLLSGQ